MEIAVIGIGNVGSVVGGVVGEADERGRAEALHERHLLLRAGLQPGPRPRGGRA